MKVVAAFLAAAQALNASLHGAANSSLHGTLSGAVLSGAAPSARDVARALQARPFDDSDVHGDTAEEAYSKMNFYLQARYATKPCSEWTHEDLDASAALLYSAKAQKLDLTYKAAGDRRALHYEALDYKEKLWAAERAAAKLMPSHAPNGLHYNVTRDGKCAEVVMLFIHHVSEAVRNKFADLGVEMPLMPEDVAPPELRSEEYDQQVGCTSCHVAVHVPGTPPITPLPRKNSTAPQYPENCPKGADGVPVVWYDRWKRCDWDYEPFCKPCEGKGGQIWGPGEQDWLPMPCEPLSMPADIPAGNLTSPVWPKSFSVEEYATLTFPGRDPCAVEWHNGTYTLHFATDEAGHPTYHSVGQTGYSGPSPVPGKSWALPNGNFYNTIDVGGASAFCICLSTKDPVVDNAVTGPLAYDFNRDAKLIGREKIRPEHFDHHVVADHWVKGPHQCVLSTVARWLKIQNGWDTVASDTFPCLKCSHSPCRLASGSRSRRTSWSASGSPSTACRRITTGASARPIPSSWCQRPSVKKASATSTSPASLPAFTSNELMESLRTGSLPPRDFKLLGPRVQVELARWAVGVKGEDGAAVAPVAKADKLTGRAEARGQRAQLDGVLDDGDAVFVHDRAARQ